MPDNDATHVMSIDEIDKDMVRWNEDLSRSRDVMISNNGIYAYVTARELVIDSFEVERFAGNGQKELQVDKHRVSRAYRYTNRLKGYFDLIVPEEQDVIYVVQFFQPQLTIAAPSMHYIQLSQHTHDEDKEDIMRNAEYALFLRSPQTDQMGVYPMVTLVKDTRALSLGLGMRVFVGYYKAQGRDGINMN